MRIIIPTNVDQLIALAQAIQAKHEALGDASPLKNIKEIANLKTQTDLAAASNAQAKALSKQAQTATETRDNALGADTTNPGHVRFYVASARDILMGLNKGAEHNLGDWGFDVIASVKSSGTPTPATATDAPKK